MRIMLATAHPHIPEIAGGAQSNMHEVALALRSAGHEVSALCGFMGVGVVGRLRRLQLKITRQNYVSDYALGYQIFRAWFPWQVADQVAAEAHPNVVIVQSGLPARMAAAFRALGIPVVLHFHNVEEDDLAGVNAACADAYIANSKFTAAFARQRFGIDALVIPPAFLPERYRVEPTGPCITFINPHPKKGMALMLKVVEAMPRTPFLFVRAWTLSPADADNLARAEARFENLTVLEAVRDMRPIYQRTRVLVMPSMWEEAWGRVATEAQFSGIPVVASKRGGIPEAVGPGGVIMSPEASSEDWVKTLTSLLSDQKLYDQLSSAAKCHSERREIHLPSQLETMLEFCSKAISHSL